jgi:hypothetical protein
LRMQQRTRARTVCPRAPQGDIASEEMHDGSR